MKKTNLLLLSLLILVSIQSYSQTCSSNIKTGASCIGAAVVTIGAGILFYDIMERSANSTMIDANAKSLSTYESALKTNPLSTTALSTYTNDVNKNNDAYQSSIKTAIYVRSGATVVGIVVALISIDYFNKDGSVTVASNGNSQLNVATNGTQVVLCLKF